MNNLKYIQLSKPRGRAYQTNRVDSVTFSKRLGKGAYITEAAGGELKYSHEGLINDVTVTFYLAYAATTNTAPAVFVKSTNDSNITRVIFGDFSGSLRDEVITVNSTTGSTYTTELPSVDVGWHTLTCRWEDGGYIIVLDDVQLDTAISGTSRQMAGSLTVGNSSGAAYDAVECLVSELIIDDEADFDFEDYDAGTVEFTEFKNKLSPLTVLTAAITKTTDTIQESDDIISYANIYGYNTSGSELIQANPNNIGFDLYGNPLQNMPSNTASYNDVMANVDQVGALSMQRSLDQLQLYNDYLYPLNENFPLELWEGRFGVTPPASSTIEERTAVIKLLLDYPRGQKNPMSLPFMQTKITNAGFSEIILSYNELGETDGYIHGNNITSNEGYETGLDKYNSFKISGTVNGLDDYERLMLLIMSIKPLDCFIVDKVNYQTVFAIDETTILAVNSTHALLLNNNTNA